MKAARVSGIWMMTGDLIMSCHMAKRGTKNWIKWSAEITRRLRMQIKAWAFKQKKAN